MADPLSVTASVLSIILPALHGMRLILNGLQSIKDTQPSAANLLFLMSFFDRQGIPRTVLQK